MKKLLMGLVVGLMSTAAHAGQFYSVNNTTAIAYEGRVENGDAETLENLLRNRTGQGLQTTAIILNSPGGFTQPAKKMAYLIRSRSLSTAVAQGEECASACMLMFAAGTERWVGYQAMLGVHSATAKRSEDGARFEDGDGTVDLAREMAYFGTPASIIGAMVLTISTEMHWLTVAELQGWVTFIPYQSPQPPVAQPTPQPAPGQTTNKMTCQSFATKAYYEVQWLGGSLIQVGKRMFDVASTRPGNDDPNQTVVSGKTLVRNGKFAAVFGGLTPKMFFWTNKEKAVDQCWN